MDLKCIVSTTTIKFLSLLFNLKDVYGGALFLLISATSVRYCIKSVEQLAKIAKDNEEKGDA